MPKKRASVQFTKPTAPVHPSLSPTDSQTKKNLPRSFHSTTISTGNSVNDLLLRQRLSHGRPSAKKSETERSPEQIHTPTVHPSLNAILQIPHTPTPRPRPGVQAAGGRRTRGLAGPPPPASWLQSPAAAVAFPRIIYGGGISAADPDLLLRSQLPKERSLVYQTLKALVVNWRWHLQYDQYYLATLPIRYKEAILSLMARHSGHGIDLSDLEILFLDDTELENATGSEGITHLDLSTFIGHDLTLTKLKDFFVKKPLGSSVNNQNDIIPESWDISDLPTLLQQPVQRFPTLTHLSLAHPTSASWTHLLRLCPHLATLTHLSLAHWPPISLKPEAKTAYPETPPSAIPYSTTGFDKKYCNMYFIDAVHILKRLSKATYCLRFLDLTGTTLACVIALTFDDSVDWSGAWRGMETVRLGQGWMPECLQKGKEDWARWRMIHQEEREREEQLAQMKRWTRIEWHIDRAEKIVNERISNGGSNAESSTTTTDAKSWWTDETTSSSSSSYSSSSSPPAAAAANPKPSARHKKVVFEHGWDAPYIRRFIETFLEV